MCCVALLQGPPHANSQIPELRGNSVLGLPKSGFPTPPFHMHSAAVVLRGGVPRCQRSGRSMQFLRIRRRALCASGTDEPALAINLLGQAGRWEWAFLFQMF